MDELLSKIDDILGRAGPLENRDWIRNEILAALSQHSGTFACEAPVHLDSETIEKASHAGELLIRAAAVLGTLAAHQQDNLRMVTGGSLPENIIAAIRSARLVSPQIVESLKTHPPRGLIGIDI